jgi:hypothetical protein
VAKVSQQKWDMVRSYFVMFKLLLGLQLALAKSETFPSSHSDNPELSVGVVEVENGMQSDHKQTETAVHVLPI